MLCGALLRPPLNLQSSQVSLPVLGIFVCAGQVGRLVVRPQSRFVVALLPIAWVSPASVVDHRKLVLVAVASVMPVLTIVSVAFVRWRLMPGLELLIDFEDKALGESPLCELLEAHLQLLKDSLLGFANLVQMHHVLAHVKLFLKHLSGDLQSLLGDTEPSLKLLPADALALMTAAYIAVIFRRRVLPGWPMLSMTLFAGLDVWTVVVACEV